MQFNSLKWMYIYPDRIEDGDCSSDEEWIAVRNTGNHAETYLLDPTRWWPHAGKLNDKPDETGGRCSSYYLFLVLIINSNQ